MNTSDRLQWMALAVALAGSPWALAATDLAALDRDDDGNLTRIEYEAATAQGFARIDSDGDGTISAPEMGTWLRSKGAPGSESNTAKLGERQLAALDQDKNGRLTAAENSLGVNTRFAGLDSDADGIVTRIEWQTAQTRVDGDARIASDLDDE